MNPSVPDQYDPANIRELVGYAADCYKQGRSVPSQFDVFTVAGTDGKAVLYYTDSDVIICFQGTTDLEGWLHDGNVRQMLDSKLAGNDPSEMIRQKIEDFRMHI